MKSLTPKKVAVAIGVSESSMKRWCDRGLIQTTRTAGGHRRLVKSSVIQFLRDHEHRLIDPQVIGLPERVSTGEIGSAEAAAKLYEFLIESNARSAKALVLDQYLSGSSLGEIFDDVIAPAFGKVGEKWECGEIEVYQERRGCEICISILQEIRELLPTPGENAPVAIGGAPENDAYSVPSLMVDLTLREKGWWTERLGSHMPFSAFNNAARQYKPNLAWLSVSHIADEEVFLREYQKFIESLSPETLVVVGGRALNESTRSKMKFSAYCTSMQQLEAYIEQQALPGSRSPIGEHAKS